MIPSIVPSARIFARRACPIASLWLCLICSLLYRPFPIHRLIADHGSLRDAPFLSHPLKLFLTRPFHAPLLFPNTRSEARDHCANERTFLSWLRVALYLAVVAVAILINFHLKHRPTPFEQRVSFPLGIIFWILSMACLLSGFAIYIRTVANYARKKALVQTGAKTQFVFILIGVAIVTACGIFLAAKPVDSRGS